MVAVDVGKPVMLINSDIALYQDQQDFIRQWVETPDKCLQFGIRWNHRVGKGVQTAQQEGWGIDAFRFTPEMAQSLPDIGYGIGLPMWDYWIPWHFRVAGYSFRADPRPVMYHERHPINWSQADHNSGWDRLYAHYKLVMPKFADKRPGCNPVDINRQIQVIRAEAMKNAESAF